MTRTHYIILAIIAIYCLTSCASFDVQTKYGNVAYDGKANRYTLIQK